MMHPQDFFELTEQQIKQFDQLPELYTQWNAAINVVSRKDIDALMERHVVHSLAIAKIIDFPAGARVLDIGTGGGFPGIPLAILFPEVHFHLVDSIGKKIKVVEAVAEALGLQNVTAEHNRAEKVKGQYHYIVSRAVTDFSRFLIWTRGKISPHRLHPDFNNGIFYLKGGDLHEELKDHQKRVRIFPLKKHFPQEFFDTKVVVHWS
jgi:16S rRNA (guanine527-N7)-methyltransferase